jgi:uncharacterized membrane protein
MQELELKQDQRLSIRLLQKQLQLIELKEYLLMAGFIVGSAFLRKAMEPWPSVEPIAFFALLAGWLFGSKKGAITGISALYLSNFIMMGGHGLWTVFQALGFGLIGYLGGFARIVKVWWAGIAVMLVGTIAYELIMDISTLVYMPIGLVAAFVGALPFTITHVVSNVAFAFGLKPSKKFVEKKAGLNEKEVCKYLIKRLKKQ